MTFPDTYLFRQAELDDFINIRHLVEEIHREHGFYMDYENTKTGGVSQVCVRMQISIKRQFDKTDRYTCTVEEKYQ